MELRREPPPFSLTQGGPFHHLLVRLGIEARTNMVRAWWLGFLVWLPIAIGQGGRWALGLAVDPAMLDLSTHVRLLFTLPALLYSERLLEETSRSAMTSFTNGNFCEPASVARLTARAEQLRDWWFVEALLLALALLSGQLVLWRLLGSTGLIHGAPAVSPWSFSRVWYAAVALPLVQFVMFRWLWRWLIWSRLLAGIARLPLTPLATHADQAGGLAPLARPVTGFAGFVLATGAILAGAWATQLMQGTARPQQFLPGLLAFLLIALVVALGPLLVFCGHLFRARRRALALYGDFMRDYTLQFHHKWIAGSGKQPLGSPDIQSLADLGQAFQVIQRTRVFAFGARMVFTVWFAGLLPMLPVFWSVLSVEQLLRRIIGTVVGGIPL